MRGSIVPAAEPTLPTYKRSASSQVDTELPAWNRGVTLCEKEGAETVL